MSEALGHSAVVVIGEPPTVPGLTVTQGLRVDNLRLEFSVKRDLSETPNSCDLTIYNLNPDNRGMLATLAREKKGALVSIEAGYQDDVGMIFNGLCNLIDTYKDGQDWVSELSINDGAEEEEEHPTKKKKTIPAKMDLKISRFTPVGLAVRKIAEAAGIQVAAQSLALPLTLLDGSPVFTYPVQFKGPRKKQLARLCNSLKGVYWSIQNGILEIQLHGLPFSQGPLLRVGGTLLNARNDAEGSVSGECLLDYRLAPGVGVVIQGVNVIGPYTIDSVTHDGSTAPGGKWVTKFTGVPIEL